MDWACNTPSLFFALSSQSANVGGVNVIQDSAVMERTNMGDSARKPTNITQPTPAAGEITGAKSKP